MSTIQGIHIQENQGGFMLSPAVKDPNELKTLTFFSDLASKLVSASAVPPDTTNITLATLGGALGAAFRGFKGVVDKLNTTDASGHSPLQNIVDDNKIKEVTDALSAMLKLPERQQQAAEKPQTPEPVPEAKKKGDGILKSFIDSINSYNISDPEQLDFLEKIVNALESSFQNLETVDELRNEIMYMIAPVIGQKFLASYIPYGLGSVINGILSYGGQFALTGAVKALLWTFSGSILPRLRGLIGGQLGLTPEEAEKINTASYASLLQSTVGLFLAPLKQKIADDRAIIEGKLTWEQIDKKINSLRASIATSTQKIEEQLSKMGSQQQAPEDTMAQVLEMAKQAKELDELVRKRAEPEKVKLETTKKDLEILLARVKEVMKNPGDDPKTSFLKLIRDIEEKFPRVPGAPLSVIIDDLKDKASKLPNVPPPLPENEFLVRVNEMLVRPEKPSKEELDKLIRDIESKFPRGLDSNAPMYKIIDNIEIAPKSETPATPGGWVVGSSPVISDPLNQLKDFFAAEVAKKQQGWISWIGSGVVSPLGAVAGWIKTNPVKAPLDKLESFFLAAIVENQKVTEFSTKVVAKASTIVERTDKVVELELEKQEKIIFIELEKNCNAQLKILKDLEANITDLKDGIDRYQDGYFKFFHKFFGTERYRVHNVLEAHKELVEAVLFSPTSNVNTEAQGILEAQKKLGEALGKLDKTHPVPITETVHIRAALKAREKLEEFRPKKPTVEPLPGTSVEQEAVTTVEEAPPIAPTPEPEQKATKTL